MKDYVVILDIHFLGIHVHATDEAQAREIALEALDGFGNEATQPTGVTGIEYGLRNTRVLAVEEEEK